MIRFIRWGLMSVLVPLLAACAAPGAKFTGLPVPVADQGDIYLYRADNLYAIGQPFDVMLDDKAIGKLYNASYQHLRRPAGNYLLKVSPGYNAKTSEITVQVTPGKTQFFQFDFQYDLILGSLGNSSFPNSSIQARPQERALVDLRDLSAAK